MCIKVSALYDLHIQFIMKFLGVLTTVALLVILSGSEVCGKIQNKNLAEPDVGSLPS